MVKGLRGLNNFFFALRDDIWHLFKLVSDPLQHRESSGFCRMDTLLCNSLLSFFHFYFYFFFSSRSRLRTQWPQGLDLALKIT